MQQIGDIKMEQKVVVEATSTGVNVSVTRVELWETIKGYINRYDRGEHRKGGSDFMVSEILSGIPANVTTCAGLDMDDWMIYSISGRILPGGLGEVMYTIRGTRKTCTVGCDFANFSRPIMSYMFPGESVDSAEERVKKLSMWQNMKNRDFIDAYIRYQYRFSTSTDTSTKPESTSSYYIMSGTNERIIADKMKRGIESIDRYVPVITLTYRSSMMPTSAEFGSELVMSNIGTQGPAPSPPSKFRSANHNTNRKIISEIEATFEKVMAAIPKGAYEPSGKTPIAFKWVITRDTMNMLGDVTFERRIQYTGFTDVDKDLYPSR